MVASIFRVAIYTYKFRNWLIIKCRLIGRRQLREETPSSSEMSKPLTKLHMSQYRRQSKLEEAIAGKQHGKVT
jgi:hypothetical protein